jgi:hypothetical protein
VLEEEILVLERPESILLLVVEEDFLTSSIPLLSFTSFSFVVDAVDDIIYDGGKGGKGQRCVLNLKILQ